MGESITRWAEGGDRNRCRWVRSIAFQGSAAGGDARPAAVAAPNHSSSARPASSGIPPRVALGAAGAPAVLPPPRIPFSAESLRKDSKRVLESIGKRGGDVEARSSVPAHTGTGEET